MTVPQHCIGMHIVYIYAHNHIISQFIDKNETNDICLPNKGYLTDQRCEWSEMATKCKIFVTDT